MPLWSEEKEAELRKLWNENVPAPEIAMRLGPTYTKNSVLGKAHRMELTKRLFQETPRKSRSALSAPRVRAPAKNPNNPHNLPPPPPTPIGFVDIKDDLVIPEHERKTIETLEPGDCRFPFGEVGKPGFHFCGRERVQGLSYCAYHVRKAYIAYAQKPAAAKTARTYTEKKEEALA